MVVFKYAQLAALSLLAVFAPIKAVLLTVFALVLADLVLGIFVSLKKKQRITSKGLRRTITKLCVFEVTLAMLFLAETYLGIPVPLVKVAAGLIGGAELLSLLENANTLTGGKVFKALIEMLNASGGSKNEVEKQ